MTFRTELRNLNVEVFMPQSPTSTTTKVLLFDLYIQQLHSDEKKSIGSVLSYILIISYLRPINYVTDFKDTRVVPKVMSNNFL